ncbi:hypothetical protein EN817_26085 [Mesorhizobium sp. M3A.F.Ca.ET.174.01.1.1]|uniref:hypothetical protein n=2 Tax=Mesorhizobium TaxID=68287 RepID=UPI0010940D42|nr:MULTISPECIES: hypothetical protein [unclassified Mesorhizobium]TGS65796.1 hypothetical protein EN844_16460 [Mesorhizobium sp. M3A.F.Ca.ET.201.01.1.1]TGS82645.1 hypothetical protein EN818_26135 [Mesorhizobium sp. M3A.F.Ca.ET.175.01.1.1]TGT22589.1 hypothetical protein EN817_26085 [Mesorhizobium sp. M3A.F.Ca.ET.174.01.1.1]
MRRLATIPVIVDQHAEDAAFLWSRRRREIDGPLLGEIDIGRIDQRLDANLEGLFASGEAAWAAANSRFSDYGEAPELFVMACLALHWELEKQVAAVVEAAAALGETGIAAISGAIARTPREKLHPFVAKWVDSRETTLKCIGLSALWHHRVDAGPRLGELAANGHAEVRIRALWLAGALRRRDLLPLATERLAADQPRERLAASLATCLLGAGRMALPVLDELLASANFLPGEIFDIRLLASAETSAKTWLQKCLNQPSLRQPALAAIGMLGDRMIAPWLIERMREPQCAFAAGLAWRDLFDVDFNDTNVFTVDPASLGEQFANIEESPLPSADRANAWWDEGRGPDRHKAFRSMRKQRLIAIRASFDNPDLPLANWRRTQHFPAWM